jgi:hypothetical protein
VRYRDATAFRQALEERLKTRAQGDGARLARDRKRVVFDRLLARLLAVAPGQWLLKGGFALELRLTGRPFYSMSDSAAGPGIPEPRPAPRRPPPVVLLLQMPETSRDRDSNSTATRAPHDAFRRSSPEVPESTIIAPGEDTTRPSRSRRFIVSAGAVVLGHIAVARDDALRVKIQRPKIGADAPALLRVAHRMLV